MIKQPPHHHHRWSVEDDRLLRELAARSWGIDAIAEKLGRTPDAVLSRANRYGVEFRPQVGLRKRPTA